jgi:hypothetical protein
VVACVMAPHKRTIPIVAEADEAQRLHPEVVERRKMTPVIRICLAHAQKFERVVDSVERRHPDPKLRQDELLKCFKRSHVVQAHAQL